MTIKGPRKPYPDFATSGVPWLGQIPAHWTVAPIRARYDVQLGKMLDEKRVTGFALAPYLRNVDVQWEGINVEDLPQMDFSEADRRKFALAKGDLLVCEGGEVGRTAIWLGELEPCFFQKALHRLRPLLPAKDDPRFLRYVMRWAAEGNVFSATANSNTIDHLTADKLGRHRFGFPPEDEQRAIAAFLDRETARIDALIEKKRRLIELLQEKRAAVITQVVTRGIKPPVARRDSGIDWLGDVSSHWTVQRLSWACTRVTDGAHISPDLSSEDYPFISTVDIADGKIDFSDCLGTSGESYQYFVRTGCKPERGDVLFSKDGTVGRTTVVETEHEFVVASSLVIITPRKECLLPRFLDCWLNNSLLQQNVMLQLGGAALRRISVEKVGRLPVVLPPIDEQVEMCDYLTKQTEQIAGLKTAVEAAISRLTEYRSALIAAAVTGQIDVREAA